MGQRLVMAAACALWAGCVAVERDELGAFQAPDGGRTDGGAAVDAGPPDAGRDAALLDATVNDGGVDAGARDAAALDGAPADDGAVDLASPDLGAPDAEAQDQGVECEPGSVEACGSGQGRCQIGLRICGPDRELGPCQDAVGPRDEVCDGVDDDCDGRLDEGAPCEVPGGRAVCEAGACAFQGCDAGRHDADGAQANGCEFALGLVLGDDLGPATAGPRAAGGPGGLAVAWADGEGQLQLDGLGPRRTVAFDVGRCQDVTVALGPGGAYATCLTDQSQCPVIRSAAATFELLPCNGPPALTAQPPGLFAVQGDNLRWEPLGDGLPDLRSRQADAWEASVRPAAFGFEGAPFAVAYERGGQRAQVVGSDGERLGAVGASLAGAWRQLGVHWLGDGDDLAVVTLVSDDRLVRVRSTLDDLVADRPVDLAGGLLPAGAPLGRLSSFEGDDGRLWITAHAEGVPEGEILAFVYDPESPDVAALSLRFPALEGADEVAFARGPAGPEVVYRMAGRARRARLVEAP